MASKLTAKPKSEDSPKGQDAPLGGQITFTESEVKKLEDFYNYVFLNLTTKQGVDGNSAKRHLDMFADMARHIKKCRDHIFDLSKSFTVDSKDGKISTMK